MTEPQAEKTEQDIRALIIENDYLYACIIGEMLKEGGRSINFEVVISHLLADSLEKLTTHQFDIVLLDMTLPDIEGDIQAIHEIQKTAPDVPIIILANLHDEELMLQGLQAGAQDYLIKGQFRVQGLMRSIRYSRERQRLRLALEASLKQEIATSRRQFRRIISESADGTVVVDRARIIHFVNPAAEALFGRTASDLLGQPFGFPAEANQANELIVRQPNGSIIIAESRVVETQWENEPALLITLRDITAHKRAEAELRRIAQDLKARNEDLDAFAHTVAHDLKNPLSLMLGFADALAEDYETMPREQMGHHLKSIARSTRKAEHIINELLLLSSVRKEDVTARPLNMADIISEVEERLAGMLEDDQMQFIKPDSWPEALGYAPWVEEVWANYISNAIKYGGSPPLVQIGATIQRNDTIAFWVSDNGEGLTAEQKDQLFTPFKQLSNVRAKGHGLGLSIVRRIVTRLSGRVGVRSEPGQGSTFFFTLPAPLSGIRTPDQEPILAENVSSAESVQAK